MLLRVDTDDGSSHFHEVTSASVNPSGLTAVLKVGGVKLTVPAIERDADGWKAVTVTIWAENTDKSSLFYHDWRR